MGRGRAGGRAAGLRPGTARGGGRGRGGGGGEPGRRAGGRAGGRAGAPLCSAGRPGPPDPAASINSFSFSLINSSAERSCSACAMPERESGGRGRGSFALPPRAPCAFGPRSRGPVRPSMGGAARGAGGGVWSGEPGERLNSVFFSFPLLFSAILEEFGTKERSMDLGTGTGRWEPRAAVSLFFRFFYGSRCFQPNEGAAGRGAGAGPGRVRAARLLLAPVSGLRSLLRRILLLLFVTCLVAMTNLMLVIMKEGRGAGAGGHPERGLRGFLWGFWFSMSFEWLRVFSGCSPPPSAEISVSGCGVCVFIFLVGGGLVFESSVLLGKVVRLVSGRLSQGKGI